MRVGLVACVKSKQDAAAPAADLYTSALFRGGRAAVERSCDRWFILSAKHGLLAPDQLIEPYEATLNGAARATKRSWSERVRREFVDALGPVAGITFEIHAGADYHAWGLSDRLRGDGATVELPTDGLPLGGKPA
jgi:hypothetical protein